MPIRDFLTITDVNVLRETLTPDNMGDFTVTTSSIAISLAAIWSPSQSRRYISDKMALVSTHILITEPSAHTFTVEDKSITHNGKTYKIMGPSDDVMELHEIMVTPLELIV